LQNHPNPTLARRKRRNQGNAYGHESKSKGTHSDLIIGLQEGKREEGCATDLFTPAAQMSKKQRRIRGASELASLASMKRGESAKK
jgi:hypothetical protein